MLRIRKIVDTLSPEDNRAIGAVQDLLRKNAPHLTEEEIAGLPHRLQNNHGERYRTALYVAESLRQNPRGFALLNYYSDLEFALIDELIVAKEFRDHGLEEAIYQNIKEEAAKLGYGFIFMEASPDDPRLAIERQKLQQDVEWLMTCESMGLRPMVNTKYENLTGDLPGGNRYLLLDSLRDEPLGRDTARAMVQALLRYRYGGAIADERIGRIVESVTDDPVKVRQPKYARKLIPPEYRRVVPDDRKIVLISNERHAILDVKRQGNVEVPVRIFSILKELRLTDLFFKIDPERFSEKHIEAVHDSGYVRYLKEACETVGRERFIYPSVFPPRGGDHIPKDVVQRAGYYCVDLFTPININAYQAAIEAVNCALTGALRISRGPRRIAYALVRPPGHHAQSKAFGGYCYLNSTSIAAHYLSRQGRVAILDLDYHHGNGHQDIFYRRSDVLTVSIHRHPDEEYPYYFGFEDERGDGEGAGFNHNFPLEKDVDGERYRAVLSKAADVVRRFDPKFLVVALGLDTAKYDPLGTWNLVADDFRKNGSIVGALRRPTLVVQEGGYHTRTIGKNVCHFFIGLWDGAYS